MRFRLYPIRCPRLQRASWLPTWGRERVRQATFAGADLTVFPELSMHGYSLGHGGGDRSVCARDDRLAALSEPGSDVVVGFHEDGGLRTYNSAAYLSAGALLHTHRKLYLPNYSVWEERKHASPGQSMRPFDTRFGRMATLICNDAWQPVLSWLATQDGADMLLVPTNSAAAFGPETVDVVSYWDQLQSLHDPHRQPPVWFAIGGNPTVSENPDVPSARPQNVPLQRVGFEDDVYRSNTPGPLGSGVGGAAGRPSSIVSIQFPQSRIYRHLVGCPWDRLDRAGGPGNCFPLQKVGNRPGRTRRWNTCRASRGEHRHRQPTPGQTPTRRRHHRPT